MNVAFITGTTPLSEYDNYVKSIQALNLDEIMKIRTAQYERFKKAMGK